MRRRILILGAGGRDFHTFNMLFRNDENFEVVAFTASQIPGIANRVYPPSLAGKLYPKGIPILDESQMQDIIKKQKVDEVILAYSDLLYDDVMRKASLALACGADFRLISPEKTMIKLNKPVIAITASRTGAGKSTITRYISKFLKVQNIKFSIVRHPMAYGDFERNVVVKLKSLEDLERYNLSIEEKEEFEPLLREGMLCFEGIDYEKVLEEASKNVDLVIWDGGNNDAPFVKPDLMITAVDPLRAGHENSYPGEINVRLADIIVITKVNSAKREDIEKVKKNVKSLNPRAKIAEAEFIVEVSDPSLIKDKDVVIIEDGPTVTHGQLSYAAGYIAAISYGARKIVDPKDYAKGIYKEIYEKYSHIGMVIPTVGYNESQLRSLEELINNIPCDSVILGTQSDISRYLKINKPIVKVSYRLKEKGDVLINALKDFLKEKSLISSF